MALLAAGWQYPTDWRRRILARVDPVHIQSVAVLPLENLSSDPEQESFTEGMTDALITDLAQISSLRVISRTSVLRYKGTRKPPAEIGKELNVDGIVEGTVARSGERVRVDAQLIQAATDRHLWARSYNRDLRDVLALQNDVAREIASEIRIQLTPQEQARLTRSQQVDPQAYVSYLKGRYFWSKRSEGSLQKSIDYLQQAVQRDPTYALAHAALSDSYTALAFYGGLPPKTAFATGKEEAQKAVQLDDRLAEAHTALASVLFYYDWDWAGAEQEYKRALELDSNYSWAHQWYGQLLRALGRASWVDEGERAQEVNPLAPIGGGSFAIESGRYEEATESLRQKLELYPDFAFDYSELGRMYEKRGLYEEAIAAAKQAVTLSGDSPFYRGILGYNYAIAGRDEQARQILRELAELSKQRYVSPFCVALVYGGLGDHDQAFAWLNKAYEERFPHLVMLRVGSRFGRIRSDPRYRELVRRIGLPP
jgi:TolB-like protein/Flp pilus assembly protein TadD